MTTVINLLHVCHQGEDYVLLAMREERWGGEEGGREAKVLKVHTFIDWKIYRLRGWFPRNGCSCSDVCSWRRCVLRLGFANKIRSISLLYEKRRK